VCATLAGFGFAGLGFANVGFAGLGFARIAAATLLPGGAAFGRLWPRATALPRAAGFPRAVTTGVDTTDRFDAAVMAGAAATTFAGRPGALRSCTRCTPS
jgi:hypothetical protein